MVEEILKAARHLGTTLIYEKANFAATDNRKWRVETSSTCEQFDTIVLANSAWLPQILEPLGYTVDVRPQKGQLTELQTNWLTDDWPVVMPSGEQDIIPFLNGKILIGATHEDEKGFDLTLCESALVNMVANVQKNFSGALHPEYIIGGRVGTRAYTADFAPFFGEVPGLLNVFLASGLGATGLTAGPLLGKILSDSVTKKDPS